jgi:poly(hydroxyalkanoate) depolymerase family esterase
MTNPLHKKLLRAAGAFDPARLLPHGLAGLGSTLQRSLPKNAAHGADPMAPLDTAGLLARGAGLLDRMKGLAPNATPGRTASGSAMQARQWSGEAGSRPYKLFVPPRRAAAPAILVMLHGCTQSAEDFASGTRMNAFAEEAGFIVLYPEQVRSANVQRCWNWFNPADQQRGAGEPSLIAGMTQAVIEEFSADRNRVFAAGLSAGGAKAAVLGMAYPDLFRAVGVHSGLACGAAHDLPSALSAMRQGGAGRGRLTVPAIVFHGDRDNTVNPSNAAFLAAQANDGPALTTEDGKAPGGLAYTRTVRPAFQGRPAFEQWTVHGLGHAWSGGSADGSYTEPRGPDASREMLRFFMNAR